MSIVNALNWRYAARKLNGQKVPQEKLDSILEAVRLAPTAYGLQPFKVIVVDDLETRKRILPAINNQAQVVGGSTLLVFAVLSDINESTVSDYMENIAHTRDIPLESLDGFRKGILDYIKNQSKEQVKNWAAKQAYIGLGTAIAAASLVEVDTSPMEGFNPLALDKALGLEEQGLSAVVLLMLGYRQGDDPAAKFKKVRKSTQDFILTIKD
ncbi:MAG TPA: NAD(P)H-dependent oxidoreductase [Cytophagales bacterium]|nr:NAD(P)H-dependent oxidoreductase [Cytophagales bacterium]